MVALITAMIAGEANTDAKILAGLKPFDDAAVYRLDNERALVASVDFFPPLVDDPNDYGRIAAANAVSDIYAMGADVAFALTIAGFPGEVDSDDILAINQAASDLIRSCGGQILGGHSIRCREPVFGLCVMGFVHPDEVWFKSGAKPGDVLMLSKPLGTGVLLSEHRADGVKTATASMRTSNRSAANALRSCALAPSAVTDITGYGLLGHSAEVAERSNVTLTVDAHSVPLLTGALRAARAGARTSADLALRRTSTAILAADIEPALQQLLFDPQTSGGLLAAVNESEVDQLTLAGFERIGQVTAGPPTVNAV